MPFLHTLRSSAGGAGSRPPQDRFARDLGRGQLQQHDADRGDRGGEAGEQQDVWRLPALREQEPPSPGPKMPPSRPMPSAQPTPVVRMRAGYFAADSPFAPN